MALNDPDDHTLVGGQELTALPVAQAMPILLDPQTARAVRAVCWAACTAIWLFVAVTAVVLAGLIVGVAQGPLAP